MKFNIVSILICMILAFSSCKNRPKVINSESSENSTTESGIFSGHPTTDGALENANDMNDGMHIVVVKEILPTSRYVYLKVTEGKSAPFWIAAIKQDVKIGNTYYYKGGLLETNFESKAYDRTFDSIYLVSRLVDHNYSQINDLKTGEGIIQKEDIPTHTEKVYQHKGSISIAELVANPKKYAGSTVQISGICTKINADIMKRNWIHLKDGSRDDYDLVVTSNAYVKEGEEVTFKAQVVLNKDFGAGYSYDLILENGELQ